MVNFISILSRKFDISHFIQNYIHFCQTSFIQDKIEIQSGSKDMDNFNKTIKNFILNLCSKKVIFFSPNTQFFFFKSLSLISPFSDL